MSINNFSETQKKILEHREYRSEILSNILETIGVNSPIKNSNDYCLAHHKIYHLQKLIENEDNNTLNNYISNLNLDKGKLKTTMIIDKNDCITYKDSNFLDDLYIIPYEIQSKINKNINITFKKSWKLIQESGYEELLNISLEAIIIIDKSLTKDTTNSYTIKNFPLTIYTDYLDDELLLAENIIHEAGHNFLNELLEAYKIKIDNSVTIFSPWKEKERPLFGFLHAVWSFSIVTNFYKSILQHNEFISQRIDYEKERLIKVSDNFNHACNFIKDDHVKNILKSEYNKAII